MTDAEILLKNILSIGEHATWQNCREHVEQGLKSWLDQLGENKFQRIYLVGCGTSYYAGLVGKYFLEHLTHLPVEALDAFSFFHYTNPALLKKDILVVGISTTGNTEAVIKALDFSRKHGAYTLAFTAVEGSRITEVANAAILTGGRLTVAVKTETYLQSLLCLYNLALYLAENMNMVTLKEMVSWQEQIDQAESITRSFFESQQQEINDLAERFASTEMVFFVAAGPNIGTAEEASLKVVEISKLYSVTKELENFFHGYDRELNSSSPILFLAPNDQASERMFDFLTFTQKVDVPTVVLTCKDDVDLRALSDHMILLPGKVDEYLTPLVYIAPTYLFSYYLAVKRGVDPSARKFPGIVAIHTYYRNNQSSD